MEDQGLAPPAHARIEVTSSEFRQSGPPAHAKRDPLLRRPARLRNCIAAYG